MTTEEAIKIIKCGDISNRWGKDGEEAEHMAIKALEQTIWKPFPENIPELDEDGCSDLLLVSFDNFSRLMIGKYREDENGGAWYACGSDKTFVQNDVYVNAFMQLPELEMAIQALKQTMKYRVTELKSELNDLEKGW